MSFGIESIVSRPRSLSLKRISVEQVRRARSYLRRDQTNMSNNSTESLMIMTGTILLSLVVYLLMTCCCAEDEWKSPALVCSWQQSDWQCNLLRRTDRQTSAYVWRTWQLRVNHSSTDSNRFSISTGKLSRHTHLSLPSNRTICMSLCSMFKFEISPLISSSDDDWMAAHLTCLSYSHLQSIHRLTPGRRFCHQLSLFCSSAINNPLLYG